MLWEEERGPLCGPRLPMLLSGYMSSTLSALDCLIGRGRQGSFRRFPEFSLFLNTAPPNPLSFFFFGLAMLEILSFFSSVKYVHAR